MEKDLQNKHKSNEIALKVSNLTKEFNLPTEKRFSIKEFFVNPFKKIRSRKFSVLNKINFEINKGDFVGIIGKNGSGKSTLLKIIAGIYSPTSGKIHLNGRIVPFLELGVGFNPELTARENIYLNGIILGMTRQQVEDKFDEIVEFSELKDFIDVQVKNFSSGMYVRLAFAIAIQAEGSIYILDEILSVGDYQFQLKCLNYINQLIKEKKTILFVTHDLSSIRAYCNKVIFINNGEVRFAGETNQAIEKYIDETSSVDYNSSNNETNRQKRVSNLKKVKIIDLKFKNTAGEEKRYFSEMESIDIEFNYKVLDRLDNLPELNIGIAIWRGSNSQLVYGTNSKILNLKDDLRQGKRLIFHLSNVPLSAGVYKVTGAIHSKDTDEKFDQHDLMYTFNITKTNLSVGEVLINTKITV